MNINKVGVGKFNSAFGVNVLQQYVPNIKQPQSSAVTPSTQFSQVQGYILKPTHNNQRVKNASIPVNTLYSPKQLLNAYANKDFVMSLVASNPRVKELLDSKNVPLVVSPENITNIANTHLTTTTAYALQIANKMGISNPEKNILKEACVFHDFGKILIPKEILNKNGLLTVNEKNIVDLHAELGSELLSSTKMNKRVLDLIKNHHMPLSKNNDVLGQILSVADIYSALRETRSYKKPLSEKEAIALLDQKAQCGEVSTEVVNALKSTIISSKVA